MKSYILADDHELYRDGLALLLARHGFVKLAEARDGEELVEQVFSLKPDLVITDIQMPIMDGLAATKIILDKMPDIKVIALTMHHEESLVVEMLEAGARGYLQKNAGKTDLLEAIDAVMQGGAWFCRSSSGRLTRMIASSRFELSANQNKIHFTLREHEIIRLICRQCSSREIADALNLSVRTVEGLRAAVQVKMNVRNTAGLVVFALRNGLVGEDDIPD